MATQTVLRGNLVLPDKIMEDGELIIQDHRIIAVNPRPGSRPATVHWQDGWIWPGLIDLHIHGIGGYDVMDGSEKSLSQIVQRLAKTGTTGFLATTMSETFPELMRVFQSIRHYQSRHRDNALLGVHMEGPFIHVDRKGAQRGDALRTPSLEEVREYHDLLGGNLKRITIAPELDGSLALITYGLQYGIMMSAGHSNATYEEAVNAFNQGVTQVTHLFNAMTGINHRAPGLVGAALMDPRIAVEILVDGEHLHPETVRLVQRLKAPDRLFLVTDAMRAATVADGLYELGGQDITVKNGVARTTTGRLAGSTLTLLRAVLNYETYTGVSLAEAVRAASLLPAHILGLRDRGALMPGHEADIIFVSSSGENRMTWQAGQVVYDGR